VWELLDTNIKPCRVFTNYGTNLLERDTYSIMVVHTKISRRRRRPCLWAWQWP
jgi:hypothetical protein